MGLCPAVEAVTLLTIDEQRLNEAGSNESRTVGSHKVTGVLLDAADTGAALDAMRGPRRTLGRPVFPNLGLTKAAIRADAISSTFSGNNATVQRQFSANYRRRWPEFRWRPTADLPGDGVHPWWGTACVVRYRLDRQIASEVYSAGPFRRRRGRPLTTSLSFPSKDSSQLHRSPCQDPARRKMITWSRWTEVDRSTWKAFPSLRRSTPPRNIHSA